MGGTMRLGAYPLQARRRARRRAGIYGAAQISERHRHRYEVSTTPTATRSCENGLRARGLSPDG